jgi:hypothetical protein
MKRQRAYCFLVVLLFITPTQIFCQQQMPRSAQNSPHTLFLFENFHEKLSYHRVRYLNALDINQPIFNSNILISQPGFNISHLPFFCKKEFQFEKNTSVPLRIRLGSLDYVNKLEGKRN